MTDAMNDVLSAVKLVSSPLLDPNTILLVNPQRVRDLLRLAPPPAFTVEAEPWSLRMSWRMPPSLLEPRHHSLVSMAIVDAPDSFELRCGPYEDVFEPWCVLKNLSTGARLVVDWPLTPYYADRLVNRRSEAA